MDITTIKEIAKEMTISPTVTSNAQKPSLKQTKMLCNVCNNDSTRLFYRYDGFFYVKCTSCGFIYQNPQPHIDDIYNIYSDNYFEYEIENQNAFFNLMKLGLLDIGFDTLTKHLKEPKRILDIGCATGLLLNHFKKDNWDTLGIEICRESASYAREEFGLNVISKPLEKCNLESNFFNVIHLSHLIEHVSSPSLLLDEIYRIAAPGAFVIVTTPNVDGLFARILRSSWRSSIKEHLFLFSKKTLKTLLQNKGFKIRKTVSWGSIPIETNVNRTFKKVMDKLVKKLNLGDVVLILAQK